MEMKLILLCAVVLLSIGNAYSAPTKKITSALTLTNAQVAFIKKLPQTESKCNQFCEVDGNGKYAKQCNAMGHIGNRFWCEYCRIRTEECKIRKGTAGSIMG